MSALRHMICWGRPQFTLIPTPVSAQEGGDLLKFSLCRCTPVIHKCICVPYPRLVSQILVIRKTSILESLPWKSICLFFVGCFFFFFSLLSFKCRQMYHAPTDCATIRKWLTKCADDSETANYISAHTKDVRTNICVVFLVL